MHEHECLSESTMNLLEQHFKGNIHLLTDGEERSKYYESVKGLYKKVNGTSMLFSQEENNLKKKKLNRKVLPLGSVRLLVQDVINLSGKE